MKLNKNQIQQVEDYLSRKGLKYIDVRYEILDHICSDVEEIMNTKKLSFVEASRSVYLKWNVHLQNHSSFWLGIAYSGPKLFINRCVSILKRTIYRVQFIIIAVLFITYHILKNIGFREYNYNEEIIYSLYGLATINLIFIFYWFFQIKKTKLQTSYSYLFIRQVLPTVLIFLLLAILYDFDQNAIINTRSYCIISVFAFSMWSGNQLYKNHLKSVSKYASFLKL